MRIILAAVFLIAPLMAKDNPVIKRLDSTTDVLSAIMSAPDKAIPEDLLARAHCIVIIPELKAAAFFFGTKYGKGYLACRKHDGMDWSAPAAIRIEGGSVGFQIGGEETDLVMLIMNEGGEEKLLQSRFTMGGDVSVAAGPVGRSSSAQTDAQMHAEILSWSRTQGLFAGLALEGATLRSDEDDNAKLYGKKLDSREVVNGPVRVLKAAARFTASLNKYSARAHSTSTGSGL